MASDKTPFSVYLSELTLPDSMYSFEIVLKHIEDLGSTIAPNPGILLEPTIMFLYIKFKNIAIYAR